jgi:hypothetical protein
MDVTKLTRVLDMLGIDCAVAHDSSMLFDEYRLLSILHFCRFRWLVRIM